MKVDLKNDPNKPEGTEETGAETEQLPEGEDVGAGESATNPTAEELAAAEQERIRKIEIENAELRGKNSALESFRQAAPAVDQSLQAQNAWKKTVLADVNTLSDEDFRSKYKFEKFQATSAILEQEFMASDVKNKQQIAELRAENRLIAKYGKDFAEVREAVDEMVAMASPEIRQDPAKLEKFMEKAYLAAAKEKPAAAPAKPKVGEVQRKIVSMVQPTPAASGVQRKEEVKDALSAEHQKLGKAFGLTSEKERKELLETPYIPMELGGGLVFRDPAKGVEKLAASA